MALELVDGVSLEHLLLRRGRLSPGEVAPLGAAIAHVTPAAHARDIVHRDVKPANVLLGRDGSVKVTDFGISDFVAAASRAEGLVFGTPGYLPPESLRGSGHTRGGDLFALGVILYECLTGAKPFGGLDVADMIQSTLFGVVKAPSARAAGIPPELERLVLLLLERDPARRPTLAAAVAEELDRIAAKHGFRWHFDDAVPRLAASPAGRCRAGRAAAGAPSRCRAPAGRRATSDRRPASGWQAARCPSRRPRGRGARDGRSRRARRRPRCARRPPRRPGRRPPPGRRSPAASAPRRRPRPSPSPGR